MNFATFFCAIVLKNIFFPIQRKFRRIAGDTFLAFGSSVTSPEAFLVFSETPIRWREFFLRFRKLRFAADDTFRVFGSSAELPPTLFISSCCRFRLSISARFTHRFLLDPFGIFRNVKSPFFRRRR